MTKNLLPKTSNKTVINAAKYFFIEHIPRNLEFSMAHDYNEEVQMHMGILDYFQYHFRSYVCGKAKTTHRVYYELRRGLISGVPIAYFDASIKMTERVLKEYELYEYMSRFYSLKNKCEKIMELNKGYA